MAIEVYFESDYKLDTIETNEEVWVQGDEDSKELQLYFQHITTENISSYGGRVVIERPDESTSSEIYLTPSVDGNEAYFKLTPGAWVCAIEGTVSFSARIKYNGTTAGYGLFTINVSEGAEPSGATVTEAQYDAIMVALDAAEVDIEALDVRLTTAEGDITTAEGDIATKEDKVAGKGLSTNDLTNALKNKLDGIETGAEVNIIEIVKVNGVALTPTDRAVDVLADVNVIEIVKVNNVALDITTKAVNIDISGKADLVNGTIPESQLPASFDDIIEGIYVSATSFTVGGVEVETPLTKTFYVDTNTNIAYRWSGSAYIATSSHLALGETESTAYRGDRGKTAYDHSALVTGNPHQVNSGEVDYDNTASGLTATKVKTAIDEIVANYPTDTDLATAIEEVVPTVLVKVYKWY